jgi:hypothetical protein
VGGKFGGVEALTSRALVHWIAQGLWMGFFSGEILVGSIDTDAVPLLVAPFLPGGRHGYLMSTFLCMSGKTLGPGGPGGSISLFILKVLLSTLTIRC